MTDLEINRRLALAIGWREDEISEWVNGTVRIDLWKRSGGLALRKFFDYRYCNVIWPIAERFDLFPSRLAGVWVIYTSKGGLIRADTAKKAVALAVIAMHEEGMLK